MNRTNLPSKNSQKVGTVVSAEDLFVLQTCPEDDLTPCYDILLFSVSSVIQRLMSHLPTHFRDSPPNTLLTLVLKQRDCALREADTKSI